MVILKLLWFFLVIFSFISMDVLHQEAMVLQIIEIHVYEGDEMKHQEPSSWWHMQWRYPFWACSSYVIFSSFRILELLFEFSWPCKSVTLCITLELARLLKNSCIFPIPSELLFVKYQPLLNGWGVSLLYYIYIGWKIFSPTLIFVRAYLLDVYLHKINDNIPLVSLLMCTFISICYLIMKRMSFGVNTEYE